MSQTRELSKEVSIKFSVFMLVFILIVVLFHSDFRYYYPMIEDLTVVSTSYFFCVSAFFFYRGLNSENINMRLKKRGATLLLPYFLWNVIYVILYFRKSHLSLHNLIIGFTVSPPCLPSWYILTLFIFFVPAPLIMRFLRRSYSTILLVMCGIVISYLGYIKLQEELATVPFVGVYLIRMAEYFTPYLLGAIIGTYFEKKIYVNWKNGIVGIVCSCIILIMLSTNISTELRWLLWILLPLTLWQSVPEKVFRYFKFLCWLTEPAFMINMVHCYLLYVWQGITLTTGITGKYLDLLNILLTLASAYVLYYSLKWFMPNILKILTGNRINNSNAKSG